MARQVTHLNLVHMWRPDLRISLHFLNMPRPEVTDTDTLCLAFLQESLQSLPQLLPTRRARAGTVNQKEIHVSILAANLLNTREQFAVGSFGRPGRTQGLGRDEDLAARDPRFLNRLPNLCLVRVELGRVDVSVSGLQGLQGRLHALAAGGAVDAESETGDLYRRIREGEVICDSEVGHYRSVYLSLLSGSSGLVSWNIIRNGKWWEYLVGAVVNIEFSPAMGNDIIAIRNTNCAILYTTLPKQ